MKEKRQKNPQYFLQGFEFVSITAFFNLNMIDTNFKPPFLKRNHTK